MSIYSSNRKIRKHSRSQPGHLRLSAYEESSALIVHIFEVRGLMRKDAAVLDVYVKLYLLPDPQKSTKKKTRTLKDQDPVFNQKFTFLLSESDAEKRLFISAWTPHFPSRNVMIGCMSIPLSKLVGPDKGLNGWFQLLDEEKGLTEHRPVPVSISRQEGLRHLAATQKPGTSEIAVTVPRGEKGYGFDVRGHNPVYVSSVEHGEAAQQADVRVGDTVAKVDDTDVRRANAELVQNLIAKGGVNLQLILLRDTGSSDPLTRPNPPSSSHTSPRRGATNTLPRSHRFRSHTPTLSHPHPSPSHLPSSVSYGALSQHHLPLSVARSSHQYSSLSHLPRPSTSVCPHGYSSSDVLSQPPSLASFNYNPQDQFVHNATHVRRSTHSLTQQPSLPHMHSVCELREDDSAAETTGGRVWSPVRRPVPGDREGRGRERRKRRSSGEELTQPLYYPTSHPPPLSSAFSFSQPGQPEVKSTHTISQANPPYSGHTHYHTHQQPNVKWRNKPSQDVGGKREVRRDSMTGEHRVYGGPGISFSPNHPSHRHSSHHHHGNVELVGHQLLVNSRGHGYRMEYGNGTVVQGQVPCSKIGMGLSDGSSSDMEDSPVDWESLSPTEQKRQKVLQSLVEAESTFHSVLQNGIETYLEPLRTVISESVHATLFCNLKELWEVSTKVELQLKERRLLYVGGATKEATRHYITHIADIYHSQLPELLGLLKGYLDNLHSAKQELSVSFTNEAFTHLVQKCVIEGNNPSIYSFIEAGKEYVCRLFRGLLGAYYYTAASEIDQSYLSTALRQLARICPDKDAVKRWDDEQRVMQKLDVCISFAAKIPKIPVVVPGRVLVREGEAYLIENKGKTKVWVILFSDIVLLTQRRRGTVLMCLEPAIPLATLRVDDFNCTEDTEFQITNTEGSLIRLLRWSTVTDKCKWMASIKERAMGSFQRRHGERQSRVSNLPKLPSTASLPPPLNPPEGNTGHNGSRHPRHREDVDRPTTGSCQSHHNSSSDLKSHSQRDPSTTGKGHRAAKRRSVPFELPDLGLGPAAVPADLPSWRRATSRRRSFNL